MRFIIPIPTKPTKYPREEEFFDNEGFLQTGMITGHKEAKLRQERLNEIFLDGTNSKIFDDLVRTRLYPYQKKGVMRILRAARVFIICPTSLKCQWKSEIMKFTGREACIVEGLIHKRKELYRQDSFFKILSYGVVRNDLHLIEELKAGLLILDEAQRIKNGKTQTAQTVKKIRSKYAIVTTGTPLENRIDELHSIVEFLDMYKLGPLFRFLHNHH